VKAAAGDTGDWSVQEFYESIRSEKGSNTYERLR
jgi:hypothetical protein